MSDSQGVVYALRRQQVMERLNIKKSAFHNYLDDRSPYYVPDFPTPFYIGRTPFFLEKEIDDFISRRAQARCR